MAYSVQIKKSSRELTKAERVMMKDTSLATKIDDITKDVKYVDIEVESYVILAVHNDKSSTPDYEVIHIVDTEGQKFTTGSASFINTFLNIADEMMDENADNDTYNEAFTIRAFRKPSKNYAGKDFLTCSLLA